MDLSNFNHIVINSSGGKDSVCAIWQIMQMVKERNWVGDIGNTITVSHQDLGSMEWNGTKELVFEQAAFFGIKNVVVIKRNNKVGYQETLLEYIKRRKMFPDGNNRYCTSDFKRGPGLKVLTPLKGNVLYVFGFRADESPNRKKKEVFKLRSKTRKRTVYEYLPIHSWSELDVWTCIKANSLPYHYAYDLGMPRLSCVFCIFAPFDALVIAGIHNPKLLDEYVETENEIGHTLRVDCSLASVKDAIDNGYLPTKKIQSWFM